MLGRTHSKRGGGSAPQACRSALGKCMVTQVRGGKTLKATGKSCMSIFNKCRTGGRKARKKTKSRGKRR